MPTGDVVVKICTASSNCLHRFIFEGQCGYGCGYYAYCDFQLPRDSREKMYEQISMNEFINKHGNELKDKDNL